METKELEKQIEKLEVRVATLEKIAVMYLKDNGWEIEVDRIVTRDDVLAEA
ncbi:MAG: hypothetical protein H8D23_02365 [Candidatus Brocadiales bacterium]|nr:hypothetical protein [Candidatus Brocadiales bacterium]